MIMAFLAGMILGSLLLLIMQLLWRENQDETKLIKDYYQMENAVSVSPHGLRGKMDRGEQDFVLVDLRSKEEYEKEHIIGAVNIPAYSDRYTSAYDEVDRIVNEFKELQRAHPNREIITYCYSTACMTSRKIGKILSDNSIYVKHLNIGWYEWRHDWNSWNHEHEWQTDKVGDYIWSGDEPGVLDVGEQINPCTEGVAGC